MKRTKIIHLLNSDHPMDDVLVKGWVRTRRDSKNFSSFMELNDGSCLKNIQVVADAAIADYEQREKIEHRCRRRCYRAADPVPGRRPECGRYRLESVTIIGLADEDYPLQKKRHSDEFLRTIAHLRPRTNKYGAAFRIRSSAGLCHPHLFQGAGVYLPSFSHHHRIGL